ncbi:MAG: lysine--tRNA ligase, partial [Pirellulales bacterium]|nr:lysine--tRNA ligase [Pirellulales bacterium]
MTKPSPPQDTSTSSSPSKGTGASLEQARRDKLERLKSLGIDPWGHRFENPIPIGDVRKTGESLVQPDDGNGPNVRVAGRIMLLRSAGSLVFLDLTDRTDRIQIMLGKKQVGAEVWPIVKCLDLGDLIGIDGRLGYSKTGELTIFATGIEFLTKSLETPPDKYHGLVDPELKQRMRYLDLIHGEGVRERFIARSRIIEAIRHVLKSRGYLEVEGPTLQESAGGAAARPFQTHHNALDIPLVLRIALELHLKRLLVGGLERVFELGRVYRNEGVSPRHNPEFTMLEVYQAFGDYRSMMDLTEQCIVDAIEAMGQPLKLPWSEATIDFTPPFERKTYTQLFQEHAGVDPSAEADVTALAKSLHIETAGRHPDVVMNDV